MFPFISSNIAHLTIIFMYLESSKPLEIFDAKLKKKKKSCRSNALEVNLIFGFNLPSGRSM